MSQQVIPTSEMIEEIKAFLPRLIEACDSISELLYVAVTDETWQQFGQLLQGMDDLYRTLTSLCNDSANLERPGVEFTIMENTLVQFESAFAELNRYMDQDQYIAAGDCIRFELVRVFKELSNNLGEEASAKAERFEANMKFLQNEYPALHKQMAKLEEDAARYEVVYAVNGAPNLLMNRNSEDEVYLYSTYDPFYEAERWVESQFNAMNGKSNVITFGFGFSYHLNRLAEIYPESVFYVYEPDEQIFLKMLKEINLEKLCGRLSIKDIVVGTGKNKRDQFFYKLMLQVKGGTAVVAMPVYDKLALTEKKQFIEDAKTAILNYVSSRNTNDRFGLQWTKNELINTAFNISTPSFIGLRGKFEGVPAVIVGAGPSLEHDIESLKKLKQHALIIAAGSSIQSLLHYGIEPHLIVSMDGGYSNYRVFEQIETSHIPLLYIPQLNNRILTKQAENIVHAYFSHDIISQYVMGVSKEDPVFDSTLSVTGTAIQAALYLGCKEVIFTGQDLSYPENNDVYAAGAQHVSEGFRSRVMSLATLTVENVNGTRNRTTNGMRLTLIDIEELIEKSPDVRFINTTSGGAKIKHTDWLPMEEVCSRFKELQLAPDAIKDALKQLELYSNSRISEAVEKMERLSGELTQIEDKVKRIQKTLNKLPELSRTKPLKCLNAMVDIEEDWETITKTYAFNTIYFTVIKTGILEFDRERSDLADEKNVMRKSELFNKILGPLVNEMKEKAPRMREFMDEALQRIQVKRDESLAKQPG